MMPTCLQDLPREAARQWPDGVALTAGDVDWTYRELDARIDQWAAYWQASGIQAGARVAVIADKHLEVVAAAWGVVRAGGVLVPINPLLKAAQVAQVLVDASACELLTLAAREAEMRTALLALSCDCVVRSLDSVASQLQSAGKVDGPRCLESDLAVLFYTSGSTGRPKGVMVSHRNLIAGASSVASYLGNTQSDVLLAVLPLSFDAGFSQLTTGFLVGARVVLLHYLLPADVLKAMLRHGVTGITAVPPLYSQLSSLNWPPGAADRLRYWANTGGRMPQVVLSRMRALAPGALPYLMYGLTEAFRSTYLPPQEVDRRPDSIGKAIPNVDVLVLDEQGQECAAGQVGELVHRGPLVTLGYWNRPEATAERFKPLQRKLSGGGPIITEIAVFSGDRVRRDEEGFLYFVGRHDDMIKTSGYRVSPTEIEELALSSGMVREVVALGRDDDVLGQVVVVVASRMEGALPDEEQTAQLIAHFRRCGPAYMTPRTVIWHDGDLPRSPNGKLDRAYWRSHARL